MPLPLTIVIAFVVAAVLIVLVGTYVRSVSMAPMPAPSPREQVEAEERARHASIGPVVYFLDEYLFFDSLADLLSELEEWAAKSSREAYLADGSVIILSSDGRRLRAELSSVRDVGALRALLERCADAHGDHARLDGVDIDTLSTEALFALCYEIVPKWT